MIEIDQSTLDKFKGVSTPTLASALYKRGLRKRPLGAMTESMVGRAFTAPATRRRRGLSARRQLVRRLMMRGAAGVVTDGVIVAPAEIAADLADETLAMSLYEDFVVDMVKAGQAIIGLHPMTNPENKEKFDHWRRTRSPQ